MRNFLSDEVGLLPVFIRLLWNLTSILNSMGDCHRFQQTKVTVFKRIAPKPQPGSLNYYFLLQRVHSALGILRRDGNRALASRHRRREVVECAVSSDHRHLAPV